MEPYRIADATGRYIIVDITPESRNVQLLAASPAGQAVTISPPEARHTAIALLRAAEEAEGEPAP